MKSQIRVDYKSRYGDDGFGDKEPLIRVELENSEDPRDTLLNEIFEKNEVYAPIGTSRIKENNGNRTFIIYKRTMNELLCDVLGSVHSALCKYSGLETNFVTSSEEYWFELAADSKVRSKGVSRRPNYEDGVYASTGYPDTDRNRLYQVMTAKVVEDFKDFEKIVKESQKKGK